MLRRKLWCAPALIGGLAIAAVLVIFLGRILSPTESRSPEGSPGLTLDVQRLSPVGPSHTEVECASRGSVEFTYQVSNRNPVSVRGLKLVRSCSCQTVGNVPESLAPGEQAVIRFRVQAPLAGRVSMQIPVHCEQQPAPLAALDASVRVAFETPALLPHSPFHVTFVHGEPATRDIVLEAIEARQQPPWISGLEISPGEMLTQEPARIVELPEADPSLVRRRYEFPLLNRTEAIGRHHASVRVQTRPDSLPIADPRDLTVEVLDPVVILPNPLVLRSSNTKDSVAGQLKVVHRGRGELVARITDFDHDLLDVQAAEPTTGSTATFRIQSRPGSPPAETELILDFGERGTRRVAVLVHPGTDP